jgi:hypothetical protein
MNSRTINIKGLNKADVLIALFNWAQAKLPENYRLVLSKEEAENAIKNNKWSPDIFFDYLNGVHLKVAFGRERDFITIAEYDNYYGAGTAAKAVAGVRLGNLTPPAPDLPKLLGTLESSSFDNTHNLVRMFPDSAFKKIDLDNHRMVGFDFSQFTNGESLVAICHRYGKNTTIYECTSDNQVKNEIRGFDRVEWFTRSKIALELTAEKLPEDEVDEENSEDSSPRLRLKVYA